MSKSEPVMFLEMMPRELVMQELRKMASLVNEQQARIADLEAFRADFERGLTEASQMFAAVGATTVVRP